MKDAKAGTKKETGKKSPAKASPDPAAKKQSSEPAGDALPAEKSAAEKGSAEKSSAASPGQPAASPVAVTEQPELPATRGKTGVFGGPKDRGIKPDDKLALPTGPHGVYERVRSLNSKSFYCAMRWNYHVQHLTPEEVKRFWANKKLRITNSKNGTAVVVRAVDYGPHENTGLDLSISPGAAAALGVEIGDEVEIALADPKSQLGPE